MLRKTALTGAIVAVLSNSCSSNTDNCSGLQNIENAECRMDAIKDTMASRVTLGAALGAALGFGAGVIIGQDPLTLALIGAVGGGGTAFAERYVSYLLAKGDRDAAIATLLIHYEEDLTRTSVSAEEVVKNVAQLATTTEHFELLFGDMQAQITAMAETQQDNRRTFEEQAKLREIIIQAIENNRADLDEHISDLRNELFLNRSKIQEFEGMIRLRDQTYEKAGNSLGVGGSTQISRLQQESSNLLQRFGEKDEQIAQLEAEIGAMNEEIKRWRLTALVR